MEALKAGLLSLWLGAALFFSAVVAPAVFGVLHQADLVNANELAGRIVSRTLSLVNMSGFIVGAFLLLLTLVWRRKHGLMIVVEILLLLLVTGATAAAQWIVTPRMTALRAAMVVPIDQVALSDPRRVAFGQLHGYSVALLSVAMLAAIIFNVVLIARRKSQRFEG